jgi:hypothetical protein
VIASGVAGAQVPFVGSDSSGGSIEGGGASRKSRDWVFGEGVGAEEAGVFMNAILDAGERGRNSS